MKAFKNIICRENGCWEKIGSKSAYFTIHGTPAHRFMFEYYTGEIVPPGFQLNHTCDNPKCCNPGHVYVGTQAENMQDRVIRKRSPRFRRILSKEIVIEMRRRRKEEGVSVSSLAKKLDISYSHAKNCCNGNRWKSVA
jgi:hypothetical protein